LIVLDRYLNFGNSQQFAGGIGGANVVVAEEKSLWRRIKLTVLVIFGGIVLLSLGGKGMSQLKPPNISQRSRPGGILIS